jgi:predicted TIM-barrel fold metal-dependent hydrolase
MAELDLQELRVVDAHCHGWRSDDKLSLDPDGFLDRITLTGSCLTASADGRLLTSSSEDDLRLLTDATPFALAMMHRLAQRLGVEATREAVSRARHDAYAADSAGYSQKVFSEAGIAGLFIDDGSPKIPSREMEEEAGVPVFRVARIERWIEELRLECSTYEELEARFSETAVAAAGEDLIAYKSIIGYIVGLDVHRWSNSDVRAAYRRWRDDDWAETRENAKPVRDALLYRLLDIAQEADRPVHIHSGAGDSSIILEHARPKDLFGLLKERTAQPIVLIHSGWPWVEEGAYLAGVFPNVYLDTSVTTPWYSLAGDQKLEVLLGIASPAKLMYGSDHNDPDAIWLSAVLAREAFERILSRAVESNWFATGDAQRIGRGVLAGNVLRLHGVELATPLVAAPRA